MKTNQKTGAYITPELSVLEMKAEGVLCGSDSPWYESEGIGDFTYGTETDRTWMQNLTCDYYEKDFQIYDGSYRSDSSHDSVSAGKP